MAKPLAHFTLDPMGTWLFAANQDSNSVMLFRVDPSNGRLKPNSHALQVTTPVCEVFVRHISWSVVNAPITCAGRMFSG